MPSRPTPTSSGRTPRNSRHRWSSTRTISVSLFGRRSFKSTVSKRAFEIRAEDDDFGFIRNYLSEELAEELKLFRYEASADGSVRVLDHDIHALRETVLAPKYNFGAPAVLVKHIASDGSLDLVHEHATDGRGLDLDKAERVLDYIHKIWRRPIRLETVDGDGRSKMIGRA